VVGTSLRGRWARRDSTREQRIHGLVYCASRIADGLCKLNPTRAIHASVRRATVYCPGAQSRENGRVHPLGSGIAAPSSIAAMNLLRNYVASLPTRVFFL